MQVLCTCDSVLVMLVVRVVLVVLVVTVRVVLVLMSLVLTVTMLVTCVLMLAVAMLVTCVLVRMLAVRMLAVVVAVLVVLVSLVVAVLVLAVAMLVIAMFMHAMTVLVVAVRVLVLVSQVRLLVPERWHKHLANSMTQQVATDKHTSGLFLRFVTRNRPCALYQVKLDPLITTRQRSFCARKLSKNASRRCVQKPNQVRWTWKLCVSQRHSLQVGTVVLIISSVFKNRTVKRAR